MLLTSNERKRWEYFTNRPYGRWPHPASVDDIRDTGRVTDTQAPGGDAGRKYADTLLERWRADLASWAIPEEILAAAPESPWVLPRRMFTRRADALLAEPGGPSYERAREALPQAGSVLDVGSGAGAASLPLVPPATNIIAVDTDSALLAELADRARRRGSTARPVEGRWPDVAGQVRVVDVVVCHDVLYNVPDLEPFVDELTTHARRRVVAQLTEEHPLTALNPLWQRFHGLARSRRPTADGAVAILRALGYDPGVQRWRRSGGTTLASFTELVETTRRRLCLPPERDGEVAEALRDLGVDPDDPRDLGSAGRSAVTLWWDGTA